jgi:hypothetical protein
MKKYIIRILFFATLFISLQSRAQFPSTDSLHKYNNHWIRNSAVEAFSQLRLNTLLHGMIDWIDSAGLITGDTLFVVPGGSNGNGDTGSIRYNDTLFIFEVSKDTLWIPLLLYAHNGLTKNLDSVRLGGTLDRATTIDQDGNGITFHDGIFTHGWGDLTGATAFSSIQSGENSIIFSQKGAGSILTSLSITKVGDVGINMSANNDAHPGGNSLDVLADYIWLYSSDGDIHIEGIIDSAQPYQLYWNPTTYKLTYALAGGGGGGGPAGAVYAANGLSNRNDSTIALGGTLDENTTINYGGFTTTWSGTYSGGSNAFTIGNSGSGITLGVTNNGSGATGSFTNSGSGNSLLLTGASGIPLRSVTTTGSAAGTFQVNPATTNTIVNLLELNRVTSGTAANGLGGAIRFNLEADDGSFYLSNRIISRYSNAAVGSRVSVLDIEGVNSATTDTVFSLYGDGKLQLPKYGLGNFLTSAVYGLGVDASGNLVETSATGSSAADDWGTQNVEIGWGLTGNGDETPLKADSSVLVTQSDLSAAQTTISAGVGITISGSPSTGYTVTNAGAPGTNPMNVLSIMDYGAVEGVTIGGGDYATGTDNTSALQDAIDAADDNQWVVVPPGDYLFSSVLDSIKGTGNKEVNLLFIGNVYTAGNDFIRITNGGGAFEHHKIIFEGNIIGRINIPSHTKTTHDNGTGPDWDAFTGVPVKLINVDNSYVQFNKVEGTKAPIEIIGGGGNGSQENQVYWSWFYKNAHGMILSSTNGTSWGDKNVFGRGVASRVSGGLAIKMDGYSGAASNGEVYNGAFRSNEFHFLIEQVDSIAEVQGDANYNLFDITIEGGTNTGVFGSSPWNLRITAPNYVEYSTITGRGYYDLSRMGSGSTGSMGRNSNIDIPLFLNDATFIGASAVTDNSGNLIIDVKKSLTQSTRNLLPAFVKTSNMATEVKNTTSVTAASYTPASDDYVILCNAAGVGSVTINMPSAASWPQREIFIRNISTGGTVIVSGGDPNATDNIAAGQGGIQYRSDGSSWRLLSKWHD